MEVGLKTFVHNVIEEEMKRYNCTSIKNRLSKHFDNVDIVDDGNDFSSVFLEKNGIKNNTVYYVIMAEEDSQSWNPPYVYKKGQKIQKSFNFDHNTDGITYTRLYELLKKIEEGYVFSLKHFGLPYA